MGLLNVSMVSVIALTATLCACSESTQGSTRDVCGEKVASANMEVTPWFVDATAKSVAISLPTGDPGAGAWVLVSDDCTKGASAEHFDRPIVRFSDVVRTADGRYAAVRISPRNKPGTDVITMTAPSGATRTVTVTVAA
jgi:hypothetical protein